MSEPDPIQRFLQPRLKQLADPFLLPDMEAPSRVCFARANAAERWSCSADYDVDGVTATARSPKCCARWWTVNFYLPHAGRRLWTQPVGRGELFETIPATLLLAVDCG